MKFYPPKIIRFYVKYMVLIVFVFLPAYFFLSCWRNAKDSSDQIVPLMVLGVFFVLCLVLVYVAFLEKLFGFVKITDEAIIWRCPLMKSVRIRREDCVRVGLEFESSPVPNEFAYIFFTSLPEYPSPKEKAKPKIHSRKGLIKMRYTDDLAKYVVTQFSRKTDYSLSHYYHKRIMRTKESVRKAKKKS